MILLMEMFKQKKRWDIESTGNLYTLNRVTWIVIFPFYFSVSLFCITLLRSYSS